MSNITLSTGKFATKLDGTYSIVALCNLLRNMLQTTETVSVTRYVIYRQPQPIQDHLLWQ